MSQKLGIVTAQNSYLYRAPGSLSGENASGLEDEIFSGWAVRLFPETEERGWVKIETHYGYQGYVKTSELRQIEEEELKCRQDTARFFRIRIGAADLLEQPKVQGRLMETLLKNSIVELIQREKEKGWSLIRAASGQEGYVHTVYLRERREDDGYLLSGEGKDYFRRRFLENIPEEEAFREKLTKSAKEYLGTQYRWGGKSSLGLDCSGLVFMSYLDNGVLIYRDAKVLPEYPVHSIEAEDLKKGDLIFFPGHVGMYLGEGRFIHSTAYAETPCVTINSLRAEDPDYREDLAHSIEGYASLFGSREAAWKKLEAKLAKLPGNLSAVYQDLETDETFGYRIQERHIAASVIKLFLMAAVFQSVEQGRFSENDRILVKKSECVPSCGVLTYLKEEQSLTVRDLTELMIIVSDNTAANVLFDLVGKEYLKEFMNSLGMKDTEFNRKMFDAESAAKGMENYVTARDVAALLSGIYRGEIVSKEASAKMYQMLTHQRLNGKIPFYLHTLRPAPVIAHKTGEDTGTTHDVAIIEGAHPFLLCFLGNETDVPEYERIMAGTALELYQSRGSDI